MLRVVTGEARGYYRMRSAPAIGRKSGGRTGIIVELRVDLQYITSIVIVRPGSR